jgi:dolichol-phosphate mannosyltransferase
MKLSVIIPARNEENSVAGTIQNLYLHLKHRRILHEILAVNDSSRDSTERVLRSLQRSIPTFRYINNPPPNGFGLAVRKGLEHFKGDAVAVYMADASDSPEDLVRFYQAMKSTGADCVFGTRFNRRSKVLDYPPHKLLLNRAANLLIRLLFATGYNDTTNAFKLYRRSVIDGIQPLISHHFNLTVELPLKAIVRGYSFTVIPNDWTNRKAGISKLKIKEMGSRYLFIMLYCLIEKWLSRGDYHRNQLHSGGKG